MGVAHPTIKNYTPRVVRRWSSRRRENGWTTRGG